MKPPHEWLCHTMNNVTHPRTNRPARPVGRAPMRQASAAGHGAVVDNTTNKHDNILLRREIGEVLRSVRQHQGRTLREVSSQARVSLGYLSEVERGQKEASSELLASICQALDAPLSAVLREVSDRIAVAEGVAVPDTVPDELVRQQGMTLR
ncbi:Helix-turn-helix domain-containing protein [Actinomyces ruminicola]|uniref:Helix-turn-helix domain-containing protein n=1 Tax=Actinomyces ruminicola TaxID=332524 RepID=A0A1G9TYF8_9ACTO|nr:Helix-turn-helix domain-containing protein [Actinomyces ruminicola]